ncbi:hypothetical protein [Marinimicrobium sp. ARAG 43.8]|uniref:hypothetical protein n=1 Tax=Marinimicrobium sp. ARAG 43.8 TaxID=3418719 RepID=UPI003CEFD01C
MSVWTHPVQMVTGLALWALWFAAVYSLLSVGCAKWPPPMEAGPLTWINAALLGLTIVTVVALLWAGWHCRRLHCRMQSSGMENVSAHRRFTVSVAMALYFLAAFAVVAIGTPILIYPPCV